MTSLILPYWEEEKILYLKAIDHFKLGIDLFAYKESLSGQIEPHIFKKVCRLLEVFTLERRIQDVVKDFSTGMCPV